MIDYNDRSKRILSAASSDDNGTRIECDDYTLGPDAKLSLRVENDDSRARVTVGRESARHLRDWLTAWLEAHDL